MVSNIFEIHTKNKVDNTTIISLDVSNQEEDKEQEEVPQWGEISYPYDEESLLRGIKMSSDIYQRYNFVGVKKENCEETIKHDVSKKALGKKFGRLRKIILGIVWVYPKREKL